MKERSCWMVAEVGEFTADRVRRNMGDFSQEKVIAKHAARMGQCFSSTRAVSKIECIEHIPDIRHGQHVYTDGVGHCSEELAHRCARILGKADNELNPSAIQIRLGGVKGVLSIHPTLKGDQIRLRPSMKKFNSAHTQLGVMKVSHYAPAHLNRQAIVLMAALGVTDRALLTLFDHQVSMARQIETNISNTLDYRKLVGKRFYANSQFPINTLLKHEFHREVMLRNILRCIECNILHDLKYRARIQVDEGVYLMGIADEFGVLKPGEIYCAIQKPDDAGKKIITGQVTIFRTPAIHPGDVRITQAVNHPLLESSKLVNVVVFSTQPSDRNLPNMLSGGDLDGDWYTVIWDKNLQIQRVHEPMDYTPVTPKTVDHVSIADITEFVIDFMKSDVLGIVATHHLAQADFRSPFDTKCIQLAELNSHAVDFPKSGVEVQVPEHLEPEGWPDFMDRHPDISYKSNKLLGIMFRAIEPAPQYQPVENDHVDVRLATRPVPITHLQHARQMKIAYDVDLQEIMRRYSLSEAEVVAGVVVTEKSKRKRRDKDSAIKGPIKEAFEELKKHYRHEAEEFVKRKPAFGNILDYACAAYQCTYVPDALSKPSNAEPDGLRVDDSPFVDGYESDDSEDDDHDDLEPGEVIPTELISFPWLWVQELCQIVQGGETRVKEEPVA
ncbi:RdRP-domain-containing protein [Rickenella mellea]|uniref:RNA-dependent RNA polymerase n=1 Tax=Rickenella mellea TaxID=50990 RepID=A0A4Y7QL13_9AGAM|nr:RdRP-domain-containing protein [Rickenella mellea]